MDLVFYWKGDGKPDNQRVWDKLNELTSEAIQTTATHNLVSWSNTNGIDLIIASGEYHDATYASAGVYPKRVQQGAYAELTPEFIEEHMSKLNAKIPALAWAQATVDGKNLRRAQRDPRNGPTTGPSRSGATCARSTTSGDHLCGHSGTVPAGRGQRSQHHPLGRQSRLRFLHAADRHGPGAGPDVLFPERQHDPGYGYHTKDDSGELFNIYQTQEFKDYLAKMVDWRKRGFWSANALNNDKRQQDSFLNGTSAIAMENNGTVASFVQQANTSHPEWEAEFYDGANNGDFTVLQTSYLNNTFAVSSVSEHADRALEWLQYIKCNQEAFDLLRNGIEGEHWIDEGEGLMSVGPKNGDYGDYTNWWSSQVDMHRTSVDELPEYTACVDSYRDRTFVNKVYYFLFNQGACGSGDRRHDQRDRGIFERPAAGHVRRLGSPP